MASPVMLPDRPPESPAMDYDFLRREGIRLLERLSAGRWTDFNAHDPGITILEQVCYAITDLAYRINYDMKDLLTAENEDAYRSLHRPAQVLTTQPVTLTDLRKLAIDVSGVKNAWFEPLENADPGLTYNPSEKILYLNRADTPKTPHHEVIPVRGVYRVLLETDQDSTQEDRIRSEVHRRLRACRPLCQDFLYPRILPGQAITVIADIEVDAVDNPEGMLEQICAALANSISPGIRFYPLSEMLARGKPVDEIMDGPALQHGFIEDAELERLEHKSGLRTSDLIREVMKVPGVAAVNNIRVSDGAHTEDWYLRLDPDRTPVLAVEGTSLRLSRRGIEVQFPAEKLAAILHRLRQRTQLETLSDSELDIYLPPGRDRKISQYHSIQHQFPATYGIGRMGLPESASLRRKAQARQLKSYLMFFDQLLANEFVQLANTRHLFSFYAPEPRTYFSQLVEDAGLSPDEICGGDAAAHAARVQELTDASGGETEIVKPGAAASFGRKNRYLDHLLARFAEHFTDYSLLHYAGLKELDFIEDKSVFLRDYREIGAARGCGFDYSLEPSENVSGLRKRISLKLGIRADHNLNLTSLAAKDEGGFHLLEHVLLRPGPADIGQAAATGWEASTFMQEPVNSDPYSNQVSYLFPDWVERFQGPGLTLVRKTLRAETPAHLRIHLHLLDEERMSAFESAYKQWLEGMIAACWWDPLASEALGDARHMNYIALRDARDRMIQILDLGRPYPLRDLYLKAPDVIAYGKDARIQILGGQSGMLYQLCDEDGDPVVKDGKNFEIRAEPGMTADALYLVTPIIDKDITFTVLAIREGEKGTGDLETYLNQPVSMKAGIDTTLPVELDPSAGQVVSGNLITVSYGDRIRVRIIGGTQEGISYKLVTQVEDRSIDLSDAMIGDQKEISLTCNKRLEEDTLVEVLAYRTGDRSDSAVLTTKLIVNVRPNPAVGLRADTSIVDYDASSVLRVIHPQASAQYELYRRELVAADYLPEGSPGALIVQTDEGRSISIAPPETITDWETSSDFVRIGTFEDTGEGDRSLRTPGLSEDTLFIVRAIKSKNHAQLQLDQAAVVLVRPSTAPSVGTIADKVARNTAGIVTVTDTQEGVGYQLRRVEKDQVVNVNPPGYHVTDRGVERARLEVDLIVESQGEAVLFLPTDPITRLATFNVLAIRDLTGVSTPLPGTVTIETKKS